MTCLSGSIRTVATVVAIMNIVASPLIGQVAKTYPVDEAAQDPEFFAFRARLLIALQQRDVDFLYNIVAPDILNSFGGNGGVEEFKTTWRPDRANSRLWITLTEVLARGGQFQQRAHEGYGSKAFAAPYMHSVTPAAGSDPFEYGVVIGGDVPVRRDPNETSAILATLSFDVVRVTEWASTQARKKSGQRSWVGVRLADGRQGYLASELIHSRFGYRAIFALRGGRWMLRALVAGD